jgi:hypothetical protein
MAVQRGQRHRPKLRDRKDVLTTIKNLCFIWVGFHSHTFGTVGTCTYSLLRPPMLKKPIPEPSQWEDIQLAEELPDGKILMEFSKLNEAATQRDSDNFLLDNIQRQAERATYLAFKHRGDTQLAACLNEVSHQASKTVKNLR